MGDPIDHLGLIWYHSEPLEVPYFPNQFLGLDFFVISYSKLALEELGLTNEKNARIKKIPFVWSYKSIF